MHRILALLALVTALQSAPAGAAPPPCATIPTVDSRCEAWTAAYDNPNGYGEYGWDGARALVMSPDGSRAFATGFSHDDTTGAWDIVVAAFDTATGTRRWATRHNGSSSRFDDPLAITTDRAGARVFVTGVTDAEFDQNEGDMVTIALDAVTGAKHWVSTYGNEETRERPSAIAVDPAGERVYVTGATDPGVTEPSDLVLQALDAVDGDEVWSTTFDGEGHGDDEGNAVLTSEDGSTVYVAATSFGLGDPRDYDTDIVTMAYEAADPDRLGEILWSSSYDAGLRHSDGAEAMGISPDGERLYVAGVTEASGASPSGYTNYEITTLAVKTDSGDRAWIARAAGTSEGLSDVNDLVVTASDRVVVAGNVTGSSSDLDWEPFVAAYGGPTGTPLWSATAGFPGATFETFESIAAAGARVYATGFSRLGLRQDVVTLGYTVEDGSVAWSARFNGGAAGTNFDMGNAVGIGSGRVVVAASLTDNLAYTTNRNSTNFNYADLGVLGYQA